jgi:hypothetical protein
MAASGSILTALAGGALAMLATAFLGAPHGAWRTAAGIPTGLWRRSPPVHGGLNMCANFGVAAPNSGGKILLAVIV